MCISITFLVLRAQSFLILSQATISHLTTARLPYLLSFQHPQQHLSLLSSLLWKGFDILSYWSRCIFNIKWIHHFFIISFITILYLHFSDFLSFFAAASSSFSFSTSFTTFSMSATCIKVFVNVAVVCWSWLTQTTNPLKSIKHRILLSVSYYYNYFFITQHPGVIYWTVRPFPTPTLRPIFFLGGPRCGWRVAAGGGGKSPKLYKKL